MKLYTHEQITMAAVNARTSSLSIETILSKFQPVNDEMDMESRHKFKLLDIITTLVAAEVSRVGGCNDVQLKYCFKLANQIINIIDTKTLPNV